MTNCTFCKKEGYKICAGCVQKVLAVFAAELLDKAIEMAEARGCFDKLEIFKQFKEEEDDREQIRPGRRTIGGTGNGIFGGNKISSRLSAIQRKNALPKDKHTDKTVSEK